MSYRPPSLEDPDALERGTLPHALEWRAQASGETPFAKFDDRPPLSAAALLSLVRRFSAALRKRVSPGERVLLCLESSPEFLVAWLGSGHAGATIVPVVPRAGLRHFARAIELARPVLAIVNAQAREKLAALDDAHSAPLIEVDDAFAGAVCPVFEDRLLATREAPDCLACGLEAASIMFTSGTTGPPKGVRVAHLWYIWASLDVAAAMGYGPTDVLYTCLPLGHANAQDTSFGPALLTGARIAFDRAFHASSFWQRIAATEATAFNLIGNMPEILLSRPAEEVVAHGARRAFAVPALAHQHGPFRERFGVRMVEGYGSTEIGVPVFQDVRAPRLGACGRPLPGTEIRVLREDGLPARPGEQGEICAWSPRPGSVTAGYWDDEAATAHAWAGGWFHTGDLGRFDADGFLYFTGRLSDSLRRKGENVSAFELEAAVLELPDVAECAVVRRRRADGDDDIVAFVVAQDGEDVDLARLRDRCRASVGRHAVPTEIRRVDELPHTESGKVAKAQLRAAIAAERQGGVLDAGCVPAESEGGAGASLRNGGA